MPTRVLIIMALVTAFVILAAFALQLLLAR